MLRLALLVALAVSASAACAQDAVAIPLDGHEAHGVTIEGLDARYRSAVHADPSLAVFADRPEDVAVAWRAFLGALGEHLAAEGFEWDEPLRGYHRFYFGADGRVERVLYHLRGVDADRSARYGELLASFANGHRIALEADEPFAQCSPIVLAPPAE